GCEDELRSVAEIPRRGASYQRQRAVSAANDGDLVAVVDSVVRELRTSLACFPVARRRSADPGSPPECLLQLAEVAVPGPHLGAATHPRHPGVVLAALGPCLGAGGRELLRAVVAVDLEAVLLAAGDRDDGVTGHHHAPATC